MTDQQRQDIINAIRDQTFELSKILQQQKEYGLWQVCPKCEGEKEVPNKDIDANGAYRLTKTCPLCEGEGKLVRPEVKKEEQL